MLNYIFSALSVESVPFFVQLEPYFCNCDPDCFTIPTLNATMPQDCENPVLNVEYHLSKSKGELSNAIYIISQWTENEDIPDSTTLSKAQWILDNLSGSPDYQVLNSLVTTNPLC